jgi:hypothetical protein
VLDSGNLAQFAEQIKKAETSIQKQIDLIEHAKKQISEVTAFREQIGDWKGVYDRAKNIAVSSENLANISTASPSFRSVLDITTPADQLSALAWSGQDNLFPTINTKTSSGTDAALDAATVKPYSAAAKAFDNYSKVNSDTEPGLNAAKKELAGTYEAMTAPGLTQASYTKLADKARNLQNSIDGIYKQRQEAYNQFTATKEIADSRQQLTDKANAKVTDANVSEYITSENSKRGSFTEWQTF